MSLRVKFSLMVGPPPFVSYRRYGKLAPPPTEMSTLEYIRGPNL